MTLGTRIVVLKDGVIQQVDSPMTLYNEPDNLFVAGFIGSPQMNFVDAKVVANGNTAGLKFADYTVNLSGEKSKKILDGGYKDKTVVMGIRPEHISDTPTDCAVDVEITGYELLGAEVLLYFTLAGANMTAKVDSKTTARMGDKVRLYMDPARIHVFDKETELTVTN